MEINEEWNNFMYKVKEVTSLVRDMSSGDKERSEMATALAGKYLDTKSLPKDIDGTKINVKYDRTVINEKACHKIERDKNSSEMDPEEWMSEVSRDAAKRSQDRKERLERADTLKTQATKAFRRGDYQRALSCYNKAIDHIKDSTQLYTDRALTLLKLKQYNKVFRDCEWALRLNEQSFKARLYQAKAHQGMNNITELQKCKCELLEKFPQHEDLIDYFLKPNSKSGECTSEESDNSDQDDHYA